MAPRGCRAALWVGVALVSFLPFARGLLQGQSFFFRDLSGHFIPMRTFALEGLRQGELRYWNPLVHEGEPVALPPVAYLPDLLQAILPAYSGISLTLALHVPFAAVSFMALAVGLGVSPAAAAGGAVVYALGGFCLSSLNLYVYLHAIAWAPLVCLSLIRASQGNRRSVAQAAILVALAISTIGIEIVGQSVVIGILLSSKMFRPASQAAARWYRVVTSLILGAGLAGYVLLYMSGLVAGSERGRGFEPEVVLAYSAHPLTFLQVIVAGLFGDTSDLATRWWGQNFFPHGFPYFLSFYLGAATIAVASVGIRHGPPRMSRTLLLLGLATAAICLGHYLRLESLVEAIPPLRLFRYPTKMFFSVHTSVALAAALGLDALRQRRDMAWRNLALTAAALGAPLALGPWLPALSGRATTWFVAGFFPPEYSWPFRLACLDRLLRDAALGGGVALCVAVLALLVLKRRVAPHLAAGAVAALLAADLLRAGSGLNPMVDLSFFQLSPQMSSWGRFFRERRLRVFTCETEFQPVFLLMRGAVPHGQDVWTFAALAETLVPFHNLDARVATAMSRDRTMLVPVERTLPASEVGCRAFAALVDRLHRAGVSHVLSVTPLASPSLRLLDVVSPEDVAPLRVHVYALERPLPLRALARSVRPAAHRAEAVSLAGTPGFPDAGGVAVEGAATATVGAGGRIVSAVESSDRLEFSVEAERETMLVVRDAYAPGWRARVDGFPAPLLRADGRHRAVPVPGGTSRVVLDYHPPGLALGLGVSLFAAAVLLGMWLTAARASHV